MPVPRGQMRHLHHKRMIGDFMVLLSVGAYASGQPAGSSSSSQRASVSLEVEQCYMYNDCMLMQSFLHVSCTGAGL